MAPRIPNPKLSLPKLSTPKLSLSRGTRGGGSSRVSRSTRDVVGLDIEPGYVAAVQASVNGAVRVQRASGAPLELDVMREGEVRDVEALAQTLREVFREGNLSRNVRLGLANQRCVLRTLDLPPIDDRKEMAAAVRFRAEDEVPMPLNSAVLDFHPLGLVDTPDGPRQRVVLVAAQRDMVERLLAATRLAGLKPVGVDLAAFAMIRALYRPGAGAERLVYLGVGGLVNLAIAEGTLCRFTRVLGGGLEAMAESLASRREIPLPEARHLLHSIGLPEGDHYEHPSAPPEYQSAEYAPGAYDAEPEAYAHDQQLGPEGPDAYAGPEDPAPYADQPPYEPTEGYEQPADVYEPSAGYEPSGYDAAAAYDAPAAGYEPTTGYEHPAVAEAPGAVDGLGRPEAEAPLTPHPQQDEHRPVSQYRPLEDHTPSATYRPPGLQRYAGEPQSAGGVPGAHHSEPARPAATSHDEEDVRAVLAEGVREIAGEVRNSLDFARAQDGGEGVAAVVLSGPALEIPGFAAALERELGLPVRPGTVGGASAKSFGLISADRLAVAAGLATIEVSS